MNNNRRNFIRNAGLAMTAAVAGTGATAGANNVEHKLGMLEDMNAIRALHERYFVLMQQHNEGELATLFAGAPIKVHEAGVLDTQLYEQSIDVAHDRRSATAQLRSRVQLGKPMTGNGTLQQMARLQGLTEQQWRETGIYTARYVKVDSEWKISELSFQKA